MSIETENALFPKKIQQFPYSASHKSPFCPLDDVPSFQQFTSKNSRCSSPTMSSKRKEKAKPKDKAAKKPYHIKRADLDLEDYQLQQEQKSFSLLFSRGARALVRSKQFYAYLILQAIAAWYKLGQVFFCVGILWMMYANTGNMRKEGEKSSWSVFNKGFEAIEGSTDMEAVEREIRSRGVI